MLFFGSAYLFCGFYFRINLPFLSIFSKTKNPLDGIFKLNPGVSARYVPLFSYFPSPPKSFAFELIDSLYVPSFKTLTGFAIR